MKKMMIGLIAVAFIALGAASFAASKTDAAKTDPAKAATPATPATPAKPAQPAATTPAVVKITGVVVSMDEKAGSFVLKGEDGKEMTLKAKAVILKKAKTGDKVIVMHKVINNEMTAVGIKTVVVKKAAATTTTAPAATTTTPKTEKTTKTK